MSEQHAETSAARHRAVTVVAEALRYTVPHYTAWEWASKAVTALVEADLLEFAPCKCGTFAFNTTHHRDGCTPDEQFDGVESNG